MINLNKLQIDRSLEKKQTLNGLIKYQSLQNDLRRINIKKDNDFQKRFNNFYKVRRNSVWRDNFYTLLEEKKFIGITFSETLSFLYKSTGKYEVSFASKLVATINDDLPIIDKFVLLNTGLKIPYNNTKNREVKINEIYEILNQYIKNFKESEEGIYLINKFKNYFPDFRISTTKMIDLVLWQTRK